MNYHYLDQTRRNLIQYFLKVEGNSISEIAQKILNGKLKQNNFDYLSDAEIEIKKF